MTDVQGLILQKVVDYVRNTAEREPAVAAHHRFDELGIDSMGVIGILVMLEAEFGLEVDRIVAAAPPKTLVELAAIAAHALPARFDAAGSQKIAAPT